MNKADSILEHDVQDELGWDVLLDSSDIAVKADNGVVTLTGAVYSYEELLQAEDDAWDVSGVKQVNNDLLVGPAAEALIDEKIADACKEALEAAKGVPKGSVTVTVSDGWVTLTGRVRNHFQRVAAKLAVSHVAGIRGVDENITIVSDPIPSDVSERITSALKRSALLEGTSVQVSNMGSTIYLDGEVGSYAARRKAEDVAWSAPGVADVVDRTRIA